MLEIWYYKTTTATGVVSVLVACENIVILFYFKDRLDIDCCPFGNKMDRINTKYTFIALYKVYMYGLSGARIRKTHLELTQLLFQHKRVQYLIRGFFLMVYIFVCFSARSEANLSFPDSFCIFSPIKSFLCFKEEACIVNFVDVFQVFSFWFSFRWLV